MTEQNSRVQIIVTTAFGKIPLDIYSNNFTWRDLIFPPIKSIIVQQGHHAAEIANYEQYNFMLEVTQQLIGMGSTGSSTIEPRRFWVMGNVGKKVDLYVFECYQGVITNFQREEQPWGAEFDGASTSGWKLGIEQTESGIIT
jgi:hypothetical protein